ncbi:predicted protein [Histoplasma mississippiense (nom. inval.)]|uniref:predicted protein n=1 Tax=Ajellomyces capsulatus (strain NAm1 / WU24) TaxID=2059318 RepID=UPI000157CCE1|nr:predicted protein [Histoplasma mississippiense (nom. inval.)]EDN10347.1 predicted protein [Histoplasma mississippiense (nom. inval.)]
MKGLLQNGRGVAHSVQVMISRWKDSILDRDVLKAGALRATHSPCGHAEFQHGAYEKCVPVMLHNFDTTWPQTFGKTMIVFRLASGVDS